MTKGWAAAAALLALLLSWDDRRWEQGEKDQRMGDRPLSYKQWPTEHCDMACQDRQFWWRQEHSR